MTLPVSSGNCYSAGVADEAGITYWNEGTINNCYYFLDYADQGAALDDLGTITNTEGVTIAQFASGEVAYLLNSNSTTGVTWYQNIDNGETADEYPVPSSSHGTVYYGYAACNATTAIYSNSELSATAYGHSYDDGFCSNCGTYEPAELNSDGYYEIENAGNLFWFSALVNGCTTTMDEAAAELEGITAAVPGANAILTADIDLSVTTSTHTSAEWTPIGDYNSSTSLTYTGTFDGNGKTITGLTINNSEASYQGLFGYASRGTVKDLTLTDVNITGNAYVAAFGGVFYSCTLTNLQVTKGTVTGSGNDVAGIGGQIRTNSNVSGCYNAATVTTSGSIVGGITGDLRNSVTLTNCYNAGDITGTENVGGIAGYVSTGVSTISNCYNVGALTATSGGNLGGIVALLTNKDGTHTITNNYYLDNVDAGIASGNNEGQVATAKTADQFASGEVTYLLNGSSSTDVAWYQTIGTDSCPLLDSTHEIVYAGYVACSDTAITYSNDASGLSGTIIAHNYVNGFCTACGAYEPAELVDGVYQITNAGNLYWFSALVNGTAQVTVDGSTITLEDITEAVPDADAVLTCDLDLNEFTGYIPIGYTAVDYTSSTFDFTGYAGTFDGQGHTISNLTIAADDVSAIETVGIFGTLSGTVKNLGVESFTFHRSSGDGRFGAIVGQIITDGTVLNCYVANSTIGDSYIAGAVAGCNYGGTIENCYSYNCTVTANARTGNLVGDNANDAGTLLGKLINCYSDKTLVGTSNTPRTGTVTGGEGSVSASRFASGEVTYLLNGSSSENVVWYQTIGTDSYPLLDSTSEIVYAGYVACSDTALSYSNDANELSAATVAHSYDNGFCTVCGTYEPAADENGDGVYEISNAGQLFWFAALVNGEGSHATFDAADSSASAILTCDINLEDREWTPIGNTSSNPYTGTFDGDGYTVSGLSITTAASYVGMFGYVTGTVQNMTVEGDITITGAASHVGGIVGMAEAATLSHLTSRVNVTATDISNGRVAGVVASATGDNNSDGSLVECCVYEDASVTVSGATDCIGGVVGYISAARIYDCANLGAVDTTNGTGTGVNTGGVLGYCNNSSANIKNCYNYGTVTGANTERTGAVIGIINGHIGSLTNCYYLDSSADAGVGTDGTSAQVAASGVTSKTTDQFASGEVAYLLNGSTSEDVTWYQNLDNGETVDAYPVLDSTHGTVCTVSNCGGSISSYSNTASTSTADHSYNDDGFCSVCGAYQPAEQDANGVYQITNAGNLYWFSALVNGTAQVTVDETTVTLEGITEAVPDADAALTLDLDLEGLTGYIPIGYTDLDYSSEELAYTGYEGTFDGQCHTISNLTISNDDVADLATVGLFGTVSGTVQNLGVVNYEFDRTGGSDGRFGAVVGQLITNGTVLNCYVVDATIEVDGYIAGAVAGCSYGGTIENCYSYNCTVNGSKRIGNLVGDNENDTGTLIGELINCYSDKTLVGTDSTPRTGTVTGGEGSVSAARFASGEVAYLLNGSSSENVTWYQNVDNGETADDYPVLDSTHGTVYGNANCGGLSYSNSVQTLSTEHSFDEEGFCSVCGAYEPAELNSDGYYEIENAGNLFWFAALVNGDGSHATFDAADSTASAILVKDIDLNPDVDTLGDDGTREWTPIGNTNYSAYTGTFDGNGKTISGLYINSTSSGQGLFGFVGTDGQVQDLTVAGSVTGFEGTAGVAGCNEGTVTNCTSSVTVIGIDDAYYVGGVAGSNSGTVSGCTNSGTVTGVYGWIFHVGGVVGSNSGTVSGCTNSGTVTCTDVWIFHVGGIVGSNSGTVTNCCNTGSVSGTASVGGVVGYNSYGTVSSCYSIGAVSGEEDVGSAVGYSSGTVSRCYYLDTVGSDDYATAKTAEEFASGEVTYLLNGSTSEDVTWYQNLDNGETVDAYPVLEAHGTVYAGSNCVGTAVYSNTEGASVGHAYDENGFCTVCGAYQPATLNSEGVYEISNAGQLFWFAALVNGTTEITVGETTVALEGITEQNLSASAVLTADIDLNPDVETLGDDGTRQWTPIGNTSSNAYSGAFDGDGYTVAGLYINTTSDYQGLFGHVSGGTVQNVTVSVCITGTLNTGGVVGYLYSGEVSGCTVSGSVTGSGSVGGVVGCNRGTVTGCTSSATVSGSSTSVGGVVGSNYGTVTYCGNTGEVNNTYYYTGGVAGYNSGSVSDCYNVGAISGTSYVGGVVGIDYGGSISNCYSSGAISGTGSSVGGAIGSALSYSTISNCYYLEGTADAAVGNTYGTITDTTSKTEAEFNSGEVTYLLNGGVTDGSQVWYQNVDNNETADEYPVLDSTHGTVYGNANCGGVNTYSNEVIDLPKEHDFDENGFCTVCGAYEPAKLNSEGVYEISNAGQLYWFAALVNGEGSHATFDAADNCASAILVCDIDISVTTGTHTSAAWTPIGNTYYSRYSGAFDGAEYTISGLYINSTSDYQGLFAYVDYAGRVQNLTVEGSVTGYDRTGGVVGYNYGTVANCTNNVTVTGVEDSFYMGGVVGFNNGTVTNCTNNATVTCAEGSMCVGGVVGNNYGDVTDCTNKSAVSGEADVGGVVGYSRETVTNCTNSGEVTCSGAYSNVAGVVGRNDGTVSGCANTATITGGENYTAGVVALNYGEVTCSTNSGEINGAFAGGVVSYNAYGTVTNCYNTETVTGVYYAAGLVAGNMGTVTSCYNIGAASVTEEGEEAIAGSAVAYNTGTVSRCYYLDTVGSDDYATAKTAEEFASGEVTYLFTGGVTNGSQVWYQNIDNEEPADDYPLLDSTHGTVYGIFGTTCLAEDYSNTESTGSAGTHSYDENGICTLCGAYEPAEQDENGVYQITNAGNLYWFAALVNGDGSHATFDAADSSASAVLVCDIDLNPYAEELGDADTLQWTPIGNTEYSVYTGAFDGNGCTISGLYINNYNYTQALFGFVGADGTVQNVTVSGSVTGYEEVGGVVAYNEGAVTNCTNNVDVTGYDGVAGVVAYNEGAVTNCTNNGTVTCTGGCVGGVVGRSFATVSGCTNEGAVSGVAYVGGVVGYNGEYSEVTDCNNSGAVTAEEGSDYVGGVVAYNEGTVTNCTNSGDVIGGEYNWYVGGVVGRNYATVTDCTNSGAVTAEERSDYVGGVVGRNSGSLSNCYSTGSVSGDEEVGGVVGCSSGTVTNCYNTGSVSGTVYVGGVVGYNYGITNNSYSTGSVSGDEEAGGVIGYNEDTVTNCYYLEGAADSAFGTDACASGNVGVKTKAQFASGEVAWLLQSEQGTTVQAWGQDLNALTSETTDDDYPVLTSDSTVKVVKLTFSLEGNTTTIDPAYTNCGKTLASYPTCDSGAYVFYLDEKWTEKVKPASQTYDEDTTLYVVEMTDTFTITFVYPDETTATQKIALDVYDGDGTYDLTQYVPEGYLYGGLYEDAEFTEDTVSAQCGAAFYYEEDDETTYYVKLVSDSYFQVRCLYTYEDNILTNLWPVLGVDSDSYSGYGFMIFGSEDEYNDFASDGTGDGWDIVEDEGNATVVDGSGTIYQSVTIDLEGYDSTTLTCSEAFSVDGYLGVTKLDSEDLDTFADEDGNITVVIVPYFVTQDGVQVTGTVKRSTTFEGGYAGATISGNVDTTIQSLTFAASDSAWTGEAISLTSLALASSYLVTDDDEETGYTITKYDDGEVYTQTVAEGETDYTIDYAGKDGCLFAGWYTDESYKTAADFSEITEDMTVYAKYVSDDYLKLKLATVSTRGVMTAIRSVAAVDGKNYAEVGFDYEYSDGTTSTVKVTTYSTSLSGSTAKKLYGGDVASSAKLIYKDLKVSGIEAGTEITITPYWVTKDGTRVTGTSKTVTYTGSGIE